MSSSCIDALNLRILEELQQNARLSITELGKRVCLSGPAVSERIRRMEEDGVIKRYAALLDPDCVGLPINAFITLKSNIGHLNLLKKIEVVPEIIECYSITGNNCMIMKVTTPTTERLQQVIGILQQIGETNTSIILSTFFSHKLLPVPESNGG